ncbi:MAG: hypothetical protein KGO50_04850 [Myxococcales bacterium]|nr:hypothetical protein [Myxococcales bacterium]
MRSSPWMLFATLLLHACSSAPGAEGVTDTQEDGSIRPFPTDTASETDASQSVDVSEAVDASTSSDADAAEQGEGDTEASVPDDVSADTSALPDSGSPELDAAVDADDATDGSAADASDAMDGSAADGSADADTTDTDTGSGLGGVCGSDFATAENATLPVDMIWVIDGSPSMDDSIAIVEANLNAFAARIGASGLDYRVVIIGADRDYCADAQCFNEICVPPPLSAAPGCPDTDSPRFRHVREGVHSSDAIDLTIEHYRDFQDFLRPGAIVHFVIVTDDDAGFGPGSEEFLAFLDTATAPGFDRVYVHSIVDLVDSPLSCGVFEECSCGDERGDEYIAISEATGGLVQSICEAEWTPIFDALEERVVEGTALPCTYELPEVEFGLVVDRVNVVLIADDGSRSTLSNVDNAAACAGGDGWYYDNPSAPTSVELCSAACVGASGSIELEFGCNTVKL